MSDQRQDMEKDDAANAAQTDMFELIESIVPLCDAGKAFVRGEYPENKPVITTLDRINRDLIAGNGHEEGKLPASDSDEMSDSQE